MKEFDFFCELAVGILALMYGLIIWHMLKSFGVFRAIKRLFQKKRKAGVVYMEDYTRRNRGK
jgi:hypothetical protein